MNKFLSLSVAIYSLKELILFFCPFRNNFTISDYIFNLKKRNFYYIILLRANDSLGFVSVRTRTLA